MARTYYVKRAQQRYETKPVIDPATGVQKQTPKMRKGVQMKTKSGRLVFMKVTERDLTRPKPLLRCSACRNEIPVGSSYSYTETYNSTIYRCGRPCGPPRPWEYSNSLSARLAQIEHENDPGQASSAEDLESCRDAYAEAVRELAQEKQESADNIESGFQHSTSQSEELADIAQQLESWADSIEQVEFPELPEPEAEDCDQCVGTGVIVQHGDGDDTCSACEGAGSFTPDEPSDDQMDEWLEQARDALTEQTGACPV